jgi:hypothetical protein
MRKSFTIPNILLISLLSFSGPVMAQSHTSLLDNSKFKASLHEEHETVNAQDRFERSLKGLQNNTDLSFYIHKDFTNDQLLQLLAALKNNTSVTSFSFYENPIFLRSYTSEENTAVINALVDAINNRTNLGVAHFDMGSWQDGKYTPAHLDESAFAKILSAISNSDNLAEFHFYGGYITETIADNLVSLIQNPNLTKLIIEPSTSTEDNFVNAARIIEAIGKSHIKTLNIRDWFVPSSNNPLIARALAQGISGNPDLKKVTFQNYIIDEVAAESLAVALNKNPVKEIWLRDNHFTDDIFSILLPGLTQKNALIRLGLDEQNLTEKSSSNFVQLYTSNPNLSIFDTYKGITKITPTDMITFANKLTTDQSLDDLALDDIGLDDNALILLAQALTKNNVLSTLDLQGNYTILGARAIMNALETNTALKYVPFDVSILNQIPEEEFYLFYERLEANRSRNPK